MNPSMQEDEFRVPGGTNFLIRIQYGQYQTWQGTIQWLDGGKMSSFRSMLEMVHLMEDAIHIHRGNEVEGQFRNWKGKEESG